MEEKGTRPSDVPPPEYSEDGVDSIVAGGVAAVLQGAPLTTFDLGLVHARDPENLHRLQTALLNLDAHHRGRRNRKLRPKKEDLAYPGHRLLMTRLVPLDLLGSIGKGHDFHDLLPHRQVITVGNRRILLLGLEKLIAVKEEVAHDKDLMILPVLKRTLEEKSKT